MSQIFSLLFFSLVALSKCDQKYMLVSLATTISILAIFRMAGLDNE